VLDNELVTYWWIIVMVLVIILRPAVAGSQLIRISRSVAQDFEVTAVYPSFFNACGARPDSSYCLPVSRFVT
jgi:hypothetical protein